MEMESHSADDVTAGFSLVLKHCRLRLDMVVIPCSDRKYVQMSIEIAIDSRKSCTYVLALSVACTVLFHHIDRRDGHTV